MTDESDDKRRDEILKRMLQTPPQPKAGKDRPKGKKSSEKKDSNK